MKDNFASKFAQPTRNPKWPCSRKETEGALGRPTSAQRVMLSPNPTLGPIPRIFHVIWPNKNLSFPGKPREEEKARYWNKHVQDVNPGWEMRVWTDDECEQLVTRKFPGFLAAWKALTPKLKMWDAIRPIILHTHGGIYLDVDVQCNRAFEPLLENASLLLRANFHPDKYKGPAMGNHIMGSAPHHPLWLNYLAGIERTHASDPKSKVTQHTGNGQLARSVDELRLSNPTAWAGTRLMTASEFTSDDDCEEAGLLRCEKTLYCRHMRDLSPAEASGQERRSARKDDKTEADARRTHEAGEAQAQRDEAAAVRQHDSEQQRLQREATERESQPR